MDKYAKLRPCSDQETCECKEISGIFLLDILSENPLYCSDCRKEIEPARLDLDAELIDKIANWLSAFDALYKLWLDSGEYEVWAKEKLLDKKGQVNQDGMFLARKLSEKYPTSYWWFWDTDDGEPEFCPNCDCNLQDDFRWGTGNCRKCKIMI